MWQQNAETVQMAFPPPPSLRRKSCQDFSTLVIKDEGFLMSFAERDVQCVMLGVTTG